MPLQNDYNQRGVAPELAPPDLERTPERHAGQVAVEREVRREAREVERDSQGLEREGAPREAEKPGAAAQPSGQAPTPVQEPKSQTLVAIENILSEGLEDIFLELPPEQQALFMKKGEETASKILILLQQVKVQVNRVLWLIREWLKLIPSVNKFFLEQEAKIKTDRLLALRQERK